MNPEPPKKATEVASKLEEWSSLVEALEKHGSTYVLPLLFRVTALRNIMTIARDWFDEWHQDLIKTPDALTQDTYNKLYIKCEEWARRKKLDHDTKNSDAMDVGAV